MKQAEIFLTFTYRNVFKPSKVNKRRSDVLRRIEACGDLGEYFNSGVLLYDTKSIRESDPGGNLKNVALCLKHDMFPDQDRLNEFFNGRVLFLDFKWNVYTAFHNRLPTADETFHQEVRDAIRDPGILHFTSLYRRRPWRRNWWNTLSRAKLRRYRIYKKTCLEIEARTGIPIIRILDSRVPHV